MTAEDVLEFWFGHITDEDPVPQASRKLWFMGGMEVDRQIAERFGALHEDAASGALERWTEEPRSALALVIVLDQFSRNMHRGTPLAFAADARSLQAAKDLIGSGGHEQLHPIEQVFLAMPFEHSESLEEQDRAIAYLSALAERAPSDAIREAVEDFARYAEGHREIIARFGRFPHRNVILGREHTPEERAYLEQGGATFGQSVKPG